MHGRVGHRKNGQVGAGLKGRYRKLQGKGGDRGWVVAAVQEREGYCRVEGLVQRCRGSWVSTAVQRREGWSSGAEAE